MLLRRLATLGALILGIAGCATVDTAARNLPFQAQLLSPDAAPVEVVRDYRLVDTVVRVPGELEVSEAGGFYPLADIVWRGDPIGNRHEQVGVLFQEAAARASAELDGDIPVVAVITLVRFHGVTERTRFSVGGVYNMIFELQIQNAETGVVIEENRLIEANLPAPGGNAALQLERIGQTERVRVTDYLTFVLGREMGADRTPGSPERIEDLI